MKIIVVNGFVIDPFSSCGDGQGRMSYWIHHIKWSEVPTQFPSNRVLKRLAIQYLGCELTPETPQFWGNMGIHFTIDAGVTYERRAAFLAAVVANTKLHD